MRAGWWPWAGYGRDDNGGIFDACVHVRVVVVVVVCTLCGQEDKNENDTRLCVSGAGAIAWWNGRPGPGRESFLGERARALMR